MNETDIVKEFHKLTKSYKNIMDAFSRQLVDLQDRIIRLEQSERMETNHHIIEHKVSIKLGG